MCNDSWLEDEAAYDSENVSWFVTRVLGCHDSWSEKLFLVTWKNPMTQDMNFYDSEICVMTREINLREKKKLDDKKLWFQE